MSKLIFGIGITAFVSTTVLLNATDLTKSYEMPDASKIIKKDILLPAKKFVMPKECVSSDKNIIAIGKYIFHNLNGKKAKGNPPKGLSKSVTINGKKKAKQYGNCVACHNIEDAKGGGNVGPDLSNYKKTFIDTKTRDNQFVYQKIADARVDNPRTHMTINLTTKLFNEKEICALTSYIVSDKKSK